MTTEHKARNKADVLSTTSFADLSEHDRPREKAMRDGIKTLSDTELMAIIFGTGVRGRSVLEIAGDILDDNDGHLSLVADMTADEFCRRYKGIGPAKALTMLAGLELGIRSAKDAASMPHSRISCANAAYDLMREHLEDLDHEEFWVLMLNNATNVISKEFIASGGQSATVVDPKIVIRRALECRAARMILLHNHPSGTLQPSIQDDRLTQRLRDAAALFDIRVDDHIIISRRGFYSYSDNGRL